MPAAHSSAASAAPLQGLAAAVAALGVVAVRRGCWGRRRQALPELAGRQEPRPVLPVLAAAALPEL